MSGILVQRLAELNLIRDPASAGTKTLVISRHRKPNRRHHYLAADDVVFPSREVVLLNARVRGNGAAPKSKGRVGDSDPLIRRGSLQKTAEERCAEGEEGKARLPKRRASLQKQFDGQEDNSEGNGNRNCLRRGGTAEESEVFAVNGVLSNKSPCGNGYIGVVQETSQKNGLLTSGPIISDRDSDLNNFLHRTDHGLRNGVVDFILKGNHNVNIDMNDFDGFNRNDIPVSRSITVVRRGNTSEFKMTTNEFTGTGIFINNNTTESDSFEIRNENCVRMAEDSIPVNGSLDGQLPSGAVDDTCPYSGLSVPRTTDPVPSEVSLDYSGGDLKCHPRVSEDNKDAVSENRVGKRRTGENPGSLRRHGRRESLTTSEKKSKRTKRRENRSLDNGTRENNPAMDVVSSGSSFPVEANSDPPPMDGAKSYLSTDASVELPGLPRSPHDHSSDASCSEDGDTDQETDRLLGQQRADDPGYGGPDKVWRRSKRSTIMSRNSNNLTDLVSSALPSSQNNSTVSSSVSTSAPSSPPVHLSDCLPVSSASTTIATSTLSSTPPQQESSPIINSTNNNGSLTNVSTTTCQTPPVTREGDSTGSNSSASKTPPPPVGATTASSGGGGSSTAPSTPIGQCGSRDESSSTPIGQAGELQDGCSPVPPTPEVASSSTTSKSKTKKDKETTKKKGRSKEVMVHEPAVLIEGVLFRARYLGSTQLVSEGQPTKTTRMMQAEEAVTRIKEPDDEALQQQQQQTLEEHSSGTRVLPPPSSPTSSLSLFPALPNQPTALPRPQVQSFGSSPVAPLREFGAVSPELTSGSGEDDSPMVALSGESSLPRNQQSFISTETSSQTLPEEEPKQQHSDSPCVGDNSSSASSEAECQNVSLEETLQETRTPILSTSVQLGSEGHSSSDSVGHNQSFLPRSNISNSFDLMDDCVKPLSADERQTLHQRFSKLQQQSLPQDNLFSGLPRMLHSPVQKSQSTSPIAANFAKRDVRKVDPMPLIQPQFRPAHSWKTQAKMSVGGKEGGSVVTVPCDGKANLLGIPSLPMVSPLPPGVLEEPIASRPKNKVEDIHGQLLEFLEERGNTIRATASPTSSRVRKQFLGFLQEQKSKTVKAHMATTEELEGLTEPMSQNEDEDDEEGVIMYEEDSNDGMDRKLQEFDDDIIEEEEGEEEDVNQGRVDDALNGNVPVPISTRGDLHTITEQSGDDGTPDFPADVSSDDNAFNDADENRNANTFNIKNSYRQDVGSLEERDHDTTDERIEPSFEDDKIHSDDLPKEEKEERSPSASRPREGCRRQGSAGNVAWIVEGGGGVGATGTVFHLRLVGSVEVAEERASGVPSPGNSGGTSTTSSNANCANPGKRPRKEMVTEAVTKLKAPEGESQPNTEVDLFISTEKIMVLNTDLKEIMMDHALRTISYIADIGDLVVLMARRRMLPTDDPNSLQKQPKMICHVFESDEAQFIAQSIGQAFQVAYLEFLKANGIEDHSFVKEMDYQEVLNSQEIFGDELQMFAKKELQKEVVVPKMKSEILGVVVVESGWGSMVPTVVIANLSPYGAAAKCGQLNIGDQIIAINGVSLVGLPLSTCQNYIKNTKYNTAVKLTVVPCPPVVEVKIRRPDTKYQLGFSVQNGVICSLLRGGIAERGGVRVGHRIIDINSQSVVAVPHEKIVNLLATSVGEIRMKTMPTSIFRLLTGQETPQYI